MSLTRFRQKLKEQIGRFKLRTKFIVVFLFVSLSSVTAVALAVNYNTSLLLAEIIGSDLKNLATNEGVAIGNLLAHQVELLQSLSLNEILVKQSVLSNSLYDEDPQAIQTLIVARNDIWKSLSETDRLPQIILTNSTADELNAFQARFPDHAEIMVTDQYGALIAATNLTSDYYQGDENWWLETYADGEGAIHISKPELDESSKTFGLTLAVPIYTPNEREVVGILRTVYDLSTSKEVLQAAGNVEADLYLDILLPDNQLLPTTYFSNPEEIQTDTTFLLDSAAIDILQSKTFDQFQINGIENLVSLAPITTIDNNPLITNLEWHILTRQNQQTATALVTAQQRTLLLIAFLIMGFSVLGAIVAAQFLTKPIGRLTAVARQIRDGNLDRQAPVESQDEIGDLAEAFNSMTIRLRDVINQLEEHRDQLEQRVAERTAELERQTVMLDVILSTTPNYFFIFDAQGNYQYASPPALKKIGVPSNQLIGKSWQSYPNLIPQNFQEELFQVFQTRNTVANEFSIRTVESSQEIRFFDYTIDPVLNHDGQVDSVVATIKDVTKQKSEQEAMWHTQKMESLGILAGGVAHDFNNLLVAMLGQTSVALLKMRPDSPARQHIEKAMKASERAAELTKQMLDYSGRGLFDMQPIQLNRLIQENVHLFTAVIPKRIDLHLDLTPLLPLFQGDPGQIQQIVMNLILNAAEAIGDDVGHIKVSTHVKHITEDNDQYWLLTNQPLSAGPYLVLFVKDDGIGMDSETLSRIFDPFFTTKFTGRGLGLAATLGIVRGHQGGLHVTSVSGIGTTFEILFPATGEMPVNQSESETSDPIIATAHTVLVIDDELPVRDAVIDILEMQDIHVMTAENGEIGITYYQQNMQNIDLIILDLSMPGLSGYQTFQELKEINPDVKIILASGYSAAEVSRQFANEEVTDFLPKPFNLATLIKTVKQHLNV